MAQGGSGRTIREPDTLLIDVHHSLHAERHDAPRRCMADVQVPQDRKLGSVDDPDQQLSVVVRAGRVTAFVSNSLLHRS